jgi:hypothetical protein
MIPIGIIGDPPWLIPYSLLAHPVIPIGITSASAATRVQSAERVLKQCSTKYVDQLQNDCVDREGCPFFFIG